MLSVLTNPPAMTALRNLTSIQMRKDTVQNHVSTGLRVTGAVEDASNFAIAQGIRTDLSAFDAVMQGLNNAKGVSNVAIAGATAVSDLMIDIRKKITEGANEGNTTQQQQILQNDYDDMLAQMRQILENSTFNGENILIEVAIPFNLAVGTVNDINVLSNIDGGTLTLRGQRIDVNYAQLVNEDISTPANALNALTAWETAMTDIGNALGELGADARALNLQTTFLESTRDAVDEGLGNIVDANMARESARLTAFQVQEQLAVQTLGLANQRPQTILGLFQ
ncbi:flagellin [Nisaea acidiphila]|uniref:Flagellin n=1 Tax=Nisaea acidiphila TaxID=1862145 RepID=A0A9J7AT37_9PROT|nr:flagellin [Nisaea acidiphila]UUX50851.1 flagellin [Nisaea acidiphila]